MARRIESPISTLAWWLFALNCVVVLRVARCDNLSQCKDALFVKLNNENLKLKDVEGILFGFRDSRQVWICGGNAARITKFKSDSCDSQDLADLHALTVKSSDPCGWHMNYGVKLFLDTYRAKRIETCRNGLSRESGLGKRRPQFYLKSGWEAGFGKELSKRAALKRKPTSPPDWLVQDFWTCHNNLKDAYFHTDDYKLILLYLVEPTESDTYMYLEPCGKYLRLACDHIKARPDPKSDKSEWTSMIGKCKDLEEMWPSLAKLMENVKSQKLHPEIFDDD